MKDVWQPKKKPLQTTIKVVLYLCTHYINYNKLKVPNEYNAITTRVFYKLKKNIMYKRVAQRTAAAAIPFRLIATCTVIIYFISNAILYTYVSRIVFYFQMKYSLPLLTPFGSRSTEHSSMAPKGSNISLMSGSDIFFDSIPMNSFLSATNTEHKH